MKTVLQQAGYTLDHASNIWISPSYAGITYSDGNEIEMQIASVIQKATDISVLSTELRQHCADWPSLYHLSGTRANIMRPFQSILKGDILEIGAGCGAITRYLGECGANVLALEGSPQRAAIARSRTRDLENVTVLAEKFEDFECGLQFDVITLIGVLEYANLFTSGENPHLAMLQQASALLKPNGTLVIAIENQLGLKYFAGAPEDHHSTQMYGIEGHSDATKRRHSAIGFCSTYFIKLTCVMQRPWLLFLTTRCLFPFLPRKARPQWILMQGHLLGKVLGRILNCRVEPTFLGKDMARHFP